MKVIKKENALSNPHSEECKTIEYSFDDKDIDLGIAIISGKYPKEGYCINKECKELIFIIDGSGTIYLENDQINFNKDDSILIDKNEKYRWESDYCKVSMVCTPAWSMEQYSIVK